MMPLDLPQPDLPVTAPDWAWLVQLGCWLLVTVVTLWVSQRRVRAELAENRTALTAMAVDVTATREQAVNAHEGAEYPNLREELTAFREDTATSLASIRTDVGGLHSEVRDARNQISGVRDDVTGIRSDARRDRRALAKQQGDLQVHIDEVPDVIEAAIAQALPLVREEIAAHSDECPLRKARGE